MEDTTVSMCNDFEGNDDRLWTAEEFLLFEGTHKELLLCHENYGVSGHLLLMQHGVGYCGVCACAESLRRPHCTVLDRMPSTITFFELSLIASRCFGEASAR